MGESLEKWLSKELYQHYITAVMQRVGMTRRRAEYFLKLWLYLFLKDCQVRELNIKPPLKELVAPQSWIECSCREAAKLFYEDDERGSDRSAGMMLDKLADLGFIKKYFDGNCTQIQIQFIPELSPQLNTKSIIGTTVDVFDPQNDAIPIANLLASNYNWLNRNVETVPYRITNILREWSQQYGTGMRVLRRNDNQNAVGFYALIPIAKESEIKFFNPAKQGLHLSRVTEVDPFILAKAGDENCRSLFVRSWIIDRDFREQSQIDFLQDSQLTLAQIKQDFPNLWDMYLLLIHPSYEQLSKALGFQKHGLESKTSVYWMYQSVNRFLALDMKK
jgi:hypothetical protein